MFGACKILSLLDILYIRLLRNAVREIVTFYLNIKEQNDFDEFILGWKYPFIMCNYLRKS